MLFRLRLKNIKQPHKTVQPAFQLQHSGLHHITGRRTFTFEACVGTGGDGFSGWCGPVLCQKLTSGSWQEVAAHIWSVTNNTLACNMWNICQMWPSWMLWSLLGPQTTFLSQGRSPNQFLAKWFLFIFYLYSLKVWLTFFLNVFLRVIWPRGLFYSTWARYRIE